MTMRYRERVQEIAARLAALPDAGHVHARSRIGPDWAKYLGHFRVQGAGPGGKDLVCGWTVARRRARLGSGQGRTSTHWVETYTLIRVYGIHDESESEFPFQESLDQAVAHFRDEPGLSFGTIPGELGILEIEERMIGPTACHVAECELDVVMYFNDLPGGGG
ncbi:hypothetical protein [Longimicrobium sp.]|uniref:hypothetical protein n=1 Tax=Longimicrobium sp. TaxID=2029185 RepID=UPI002E30F98E|nr:hypothetical protein [Longimicrobium sp.]HEX6038043.1 hypothetical protein [Longimicrobium sp.]